MKTFTLILTDSSPDETRIRIIKEKTPEDALYKFLTEISEFDTKKDYDIIASILSNNPIGIYEVSDLDTPDIEWYYELPD